MASACALLTGFLTGFLTTFFLRGFLAAMTTVVEATRAGTATAEEAELTASLEAGTMKASLL